MQRPMTRAAQRRVSRNMRKLGRRERRLGLRSTETSLSGKTQKVITKREAKFWAPPESLGGKARGYAYGYEGSWEGARQLDRWPRDRLRKADYA